MLGLERSLGSRIVTYADDLVILCGRGKGEEALARMRELMGKLKLDGQPLSFSRRPQSPRCSCRRSPQGFSTKRDNLRRFQLGAIGTDEPLRQLTDWIDHQAKAVRMVEERTLRLAVGTTEENAEVWMTVIPANHHLLASAFGPKRKWAALVLAHPELM